MSKKRFNPDEFLERERSGFDPDKFLQENLAQDVEETKSPDNPVPDPPQSTMSGMADMFLGTTESEPQGLNPVMSFLNIFSSRIANTPADLGEAWAIGSAFAERQLAKLNVPGASKDVKATDVWSYKLADDWRKYMDEVYPTREGDRETFGGQVVDGLGQIVPIVLTGGKSAVKDLAKTAIKTGSNLTPYINSAKEVISRFGSAQGLIAGSQIAAPSYRQAIEEGASEEDALQFAIENMTVGSVIETLPVQAIFSRLSKIKPDAKILDVLKDGATGFTEETVTEMWQETYANMSAQRIYDTNRDILEGVGDAGAVGGTVGFLLNTMASALTGVRARFSTNDKGILDKSLEEISEKTSIVEDNNIRLEETVIELENTKTRVLTDGARDIPFVQGTDGIIEHTEDGLSRDEAEGIATTLGQKYDKLQFESVENTPDDPFAEPDFTVRGVVKTDAPAYSRNGQEITKPVADFLIKGATSRSELEGLQIENDQELMEEFQQKFESLPEETTNEYQQANEPDNVQPEETVADDQRAEQPVDENVPQEPVDQSADGEVPVDEVETPSFEVEKAEPIGGGEEIEFVKIGNKYIDADIHDNQAMSGVPVHELSNKLLVDQRLDDLYSDRSLGDGDFNESELSEINEAIGFLEKFTDKRDIKEGVDPTVEDVGNTSQVEGPNKAKESSFIEGDMKPEGMYIRVAKLGDDGNMRIGYESPKGAKINPKYKNTRVFYHKDQDGKKTIISNIDSGLKVTEGNTQKEAFEKLDALIEKYGGEDGLVNVMNSAAESRATQEAATNQQSESVIESEPISETPVESESSPTERVSFTVFGEPKTGVRTGDRFLGDDGTIYMPSMVDDITEINTPKDRIAAQKKVVRNAVKKAKESLLKGDSNVGFFQDFDKLARSKVKDEIEFYKSLQNLVVEYAKLKGMQLSEAIRQIEGLIGSTLKQNDRKHIKSLWDEAVKENRPLPTKQQIKKSTEGKPDSKKETLVNEYSELKRSLRERSRAALDGYRAGVKEAKGKAKEKADHLQSLKNSLTQIIQDDLKDTPVDNFTKQELNSIIGEINKAKTDYSVNKAINKALDIYSRAGRRKQISDANKSRNVAKNNLKSGKIGVVESNGRLDKLLRIDARAVPAEVFGEYQNLLESIGKRKSVLNLKESGEIMAQVNSIMDAVEVENGRVDDLASMYEDAEKVVIKDKDGSRESYSGTVDKLLKDGVITEDDARLMRERKKDIVSITRSTDPADVDAMIDDAISSKSIVPNAGNQFTPDENRIVRLFKSLTKEDLTALDPKDLRRVPAIMDNLSNGIIPHSAEKIRAKVEGNRSAKNIQPVLKWYKGNVFDWVSRTKAGVKNIFKPNSTSLMAEKIARNPTVYIDQVLGNFKNTVLYDNTFGKLSKSYGSYEHDLKSISETLRQAEASIPAKKQFESRAKMMMVALQMELESNPGGKVHSAKDWVEATLKDKNSPYTQQSKDEIQRILDENSTDGEFDIQKATRTFSKEEHKAFISINEINRSLSPKADFTATVINGSRVPIYQNYVHVPLYVRGGRQNEMDLEAPFYGAPVKAGTLTERTGKAHAISFDLFNNVLSGAKKTLLNYHMQPTVNEVNQTIRKMEKEAEGKDLEAVHVLDEAIKNVHNNVVGSSVANNSIADDIVSEITKKGYQTVLSGIGRSISEFTSNAIFAGVYKRAETESGIKNLNKINKISPEAFSNIVRNTGSSQSVRLSDFVRSDSKFVDVSSFRVSELSKATGVEKGMVEKIFRGTVNNPVYKGIDVLQSLVLSKPDQLVSRPMWIGTFASEFEAATGKKPDFEKIAGNDSDYMESNREAITAATNEADNVMVEAVSSSNPYDGIQRNAIKPSSNWLTSFFKTFNSFMTRFPTYEYNSAVRAVNSLTGNGMLTKAEGAKLLGALSSRLMIYGMMTQTMLPFAYKGIANVLGYPAGVSIEDDENDDNMLQVLTNELFSAIAMLTVNRNIGNVAKAPINYALENFNKNYLEGITYEGEYDGFGDNIVYPLLPIDDKSFKPTYQSIIENASGPLSPMVKTGFRTFTAADRLTNSKREETKEKYRKELITRTPIEVFGNLGYIPFYRDVRKVMLELMYNTEKNIKKESVNSGINWDNIKK